MMKLNDFIKKLELALKEPSYYLSGGWGKWNGSKWGWDCCNLGKGIIWGWNNNKNIPRGGGANYGTNNMPDVNETQMFNMCTNISTDFSKIKKGEFVWLTGHIGYYIGNGYVIEATKDGTFNADGVIKSKIGSNGERIYKGVQSLRWLKHGYFPLIDYGNNPTPYFIEGKDYKLLIAKCIRRTPNLSNNILKVKQVDSWTKQYLTSKNANANAMLKVGFEVTPIKIVNENGRIWGSYGNCWICLCNADGTKQCEKIN